MAAFSDAVSSLEAEVGNAEQRIAAHVADLTNKLADAEKKVADAPTADDLAKLQSLIDRIKALQ